MTGDRRKEIVRHLSVDDFDRLLAETDDDKISKRLIFVKRLYSVDNPHITRSLVRHDEPAVGFYALNGESVASFPEIRRMNGSVRVSNASASRIRAREFCSSWTIFPRWFVNTRASVPLTWDRSRVFLVGSPCLNPIGPVWKRLTWDASPMIVESAAEFRALVAELFDRLTNRLSFATSLIDEFLHSRLQKLS